MRNKMPRHEKLTHSRLTNSRSLNIVNNNKSIALLLFKYAENIVTAYDLDIKTVRFIVSLICIRSRKELLKYLLSISSKSHRSKGEADDILEHLDCADYFTDALFEHFSLIISRKSSTIKKHLIRYIYKEKERVCGGEEFRIRKHGENRDGSDPQAANNCSSSDSKSCDTENRDCFSKNLRALKELFNLSDNEVSFISFVYCKMQRIFFDHLIRDLSVVEYVQFVSIATGLKTDEVRKMTGDNSNLVKCGILEEYKFSTDVPDLDKEAFNILSGFDDISYAEKYCHKDSGTVFKLNSFNMPAESISIIKSLLLSNDRCNILLYGSAGTGKTEFARSVVADCNLSAYFIQYGANGQTSERRFALKVTSEVAVKNKCVVIVDEADCFINSRIMFFTHMETTEKGWLNNFIDSSKAKIIWIANHTGLMEESVMRRFSYSLQFKPFTRRERQNIWLSLVKNHPLKQYFTPEFISSISSSYSLNPAEISMALDVLIKAIPPDQTDCILISRMLEEMFVQRMKLKGLRNKKMIPLSEQTYDVSVLNTDIDTKIIVEAVKQFVVFQNDIGGAADSGNESKYQNIPVRNANLNLLFWGMPGTGKTEFAKYLSVQAGLDLMIKRASDLLSPWIGATEQNISSVFEEAEREGAILFIDEADSFFYSRESAYRSWEISQTNEMLTQMENHKGILICCTNLLANLDCAAMRRFQWKIEFKPLLPEGKLKCYMEYFANNNDGKNKDKHYRQILVADQAQRIMKIENLTPGDIKAVWTKFQFVRIDELNHNAIISALESEVKYRKKKNKEKVGFMI
jgi:SpoVK/Ycf46/Vps4 family AAA+-type ATPase